MASIGSTPGQTRRRSLDAEINLVPFIDLLSMCICFLLMTAIWVEIGSIQIKQLFGTESAAADSQSLDVLVRFNSNADIQINLEKQGRVVQSTTIDGQSFDQKLSRLNQFVGSLALTLGQNQEGSPHIVGRIVPATVVKYGQLVSVLDVLRSHGISNVGIVPTKE